jgi:translation initiation factor 1 (eIF-1/SUI1)
VQPHLLPALPVSLQKKPWLKLQVEARSNSNMPLTTECSETLQVMISWNQLRFMADQGFQAFEDNGMSGRDTATQEKMAALMGRLNIQMGVFVAHKIYWSEPNLASGNAEKRREFLEDIKKSVEIARRVNAKWVTVVPGFKDLRQDMGFQTAHVVESLKQACDTGTTRTGHGTGTTEFQGSPRIVPYRCATGTCNM